jgi:hypothetical protein
MNVEQKIDFIKSQLEEGRFLPQLNEVKRKMNNKARDRFEWIQDVVEKEVRSVFSDELDQYKRRKDAIHAEYSARSAVWPDKESFKKVAEIIHKKISDELENYKRPDIKKWVSASIDDDFVRMCEGESDKEFVNLVISKFIWDHSKKMGSVRGNVGM